MQVILLPLHADLYALELTAVREVVPGPDVMPLPGAPPSLLGVFNLRGDVVPLFDTARLLGLDHAPSADQVTVADTAAGLAGLVSHERPRREELGQSAGPAALPASRGRFAVDATAVATLLDVERLLVGARSR